MNETDQLKQETERQYVIQRYKELNDYLDVLWKEIEVRHKRANDAWIIYGVAWLSWVIVGFVNVSQQYNFAMIFLMALCYQSFRHSKLASSHGKFMGAINVMRILGMIPPDNEKGIKNKKQIWNEGIEIVKGWISQKKEAQSTGYAAA